MLIELILVPYEQRFDVTVEEDFEWIHQSQYLFVSFLMKLHDFFPFSLFSVELRRVFSTFLSFSPWNCCIIFFSRINELFHYFFSIKSSLIRIHLIKIHSQSGFHYWKISVCFVSILKLSLNKFAIFLFCCRASELIYIHTKIKVLCVTKSP